MTDWAMTGHSIPAARHWNTWDPVHPAEVVHLPTGTHVVLAAYSDATGRLSRFPPGAGVTLGPRSVDATAIDLELELAGTRLAVRIGGAGPDSFKISWRTLANGEWGLRFWLLVCLWREAGPGDRDSGCHYDPDSTEMWASGGDGCVVLKGPRFPLMATFHGDLAALAEEFETKGYFYLSREVLELDPDIWKRDVSGSHRVEPGVGGTRGRAPENRQPRGLERGAPSTPGF